MLLVLIRSASARHFWWVSTTCFHGEIRKLSFLFDRKKSLIWRYGLCLRLKKNGYIPRESTLIWKYLPAFSRGVDLKERTPPALPALVAQLDACSTGDQEVASLTPAGEWQHSFRGVRSWNVFYGHSLPSAGSRRAVVSFWWKSVHNTG